MANNRLISSKDVQRATSKAFGASLVEPIPARLGHPTPSAVSSPVEVPLSEAGAPGYVYIHDAETAGGDGGGVSMVLNSGKGKLTREQMVYGAYIYIKRRKRGWVMDGLDEERNAEYMANAVIRPQTSISLTQFDNGLLQPTNPPSMKALVGGGMYRFGQNLLNLNPIPTINFTDEIPVTVGMAVAWLVELMPASGKLYYTAGIEFDATLKHSEAFAYYYPQPTGKGMVTGWVKLIQGMTAILLAVHILPGHEILSADPITYAYRSRYGGVFLNSKGKVIVRGR